MSKIDRILDKFSAKREQLFSNISEHDYESAPHVWLAGYKTLGENSARIILGSTKEITPDQARLAVPNVTKGEMTAYVASFSPLNVESNGNQAKLKYASVYAVKPKAHFRKATDEVMAKCKMISSTQYLDVELENVWDRKEINGESYLVRLNENNPEDILKAALLAKTDASYTVNSDNFIITDSARPGDYVEFFALASDNDANGNVTPFMDIAQVVANNKDSLEIEIKDGNYSTKANISAHAVKTVIQASEGTTRQQVMDYLYKAYGDRWKEIVEKTGAFNVDAQGNV